MRRCAMPNPMNTYEVVVKKTCYVTYKVHALTPADATDKAERGLILNDVKLLGSTTIDVDVESIECIEKEVCNA